MRNHYPNHPIFLMGHSLGGQLAALYLALNSDGAHGLITIAAASVHYKQYPFATRLIVLAGTQLAWAIARINGFFPGEIVGFGGREAYGVIRDWAQLRTGRYELSGCDHAFESLMAAVEKPVLAISVAGDWIGPERAVSHLCGKLKRASITRWHYRQSSEGQTRIDHFRWVKHAQPIVETISAWILAQAPAETKCSVSSKCGPVGVQEADEHVIQGEFGDSEGPKPMGCSHGHFDLVVQPRCDAIGDLLFFARK